MSESTHTVFGENLLIYTYQEGEVKEYPYYLSKVQAGFPSPADDYIESRLTLDSHLIAHPEATFFVRATGNSMAPTVKPNDLLIVDKSIEAQHGDIIIAAVSGDLTLKRLYHKEGIVKLLPDNPQFLPYTVTEEVDLVVWGVVIHIIHSPKVCLP